MTTMYTIRVGKIEIANSTWIKFITHVVTAFAHEIAQGWSGLVAEQWSGFG